MSAETFESNNDNERRHRLSKIAAKVVEKAGVGEVESLVEDAIEVLDRDGDIEALREEGWDETRLKIARGLAHAYKNAITSGNGDTTRDDDIFEEAANSNVHLLDKDSPTTDLVKTYLKSIGKVELLNAAKEVELAKRIEAGVYAAHKLDEVKYEDDKGGIHYSGMTREEQRNLEWIQRDGDRAKRHMLEANLRLVVSLAKRYTGRGMPLLDLIQEGNLGLIRAMEKFDYAKGFKFSTYATWWIRQAITRGMADQARTIRLPVHLVEVVNKVGRIERELNQDLGRPPDDEEVAEGAGISVEKLNEIRSYAREPVSLSMPVGNEEGTELGDFIGDAQAVDGVDAATFALLQQQLRQVLTTLDEREAGVIRLRFGLDDGNPRTLDDIGKVYGVTRERIRQIESKTMSKLRHPSRSDVLRDYLE